MAIKAKKILKRFFITLGVLFGLLIGAAIAVPYFFKDDILAKIEQLVNENVNAIVSLEDANVSMFRSFPNISLRLEGLEVIGLDEFDGLRLAGVDKFDVALDFNSVRNPNRPIEIKNISLTDANLYVKVLKDGTANYDIAIPSENTDSSTTAPSGEATPFEIDLKAYALNNANITYDDASSDMFVKIEGLNHKGSGKFTESIYDLKTITTAEAIDFDFAGIQYLTKAKADMDVTVNMNMTESVYTLKENSIRLNALGIDVDGFVKMPDENIEMDLVFSSPSTNFKDLLSMVPAAYTEDFGKVKADGTMSLKGDVKGIYNSDSYPTFNVNIVAENGSFQYPDLPMGMKNIATNIFINSPDTDLDKMEVNISKFHVDLGSNSFDARMMIKNPLTDPYVDSKVNGKIILDDLAKAFPLDEQGITALSGVINANLETNTRISSVTNGQYDKVTMKGNLDINNMNYQAEGMPTIVIKDLKTDFTPDKVNIENFEANLGKSDLKVSGTLDNILTYFSGTNTMKGNLVVRSSLFDANEWMESGSDEEPVNEPTVVVEDTTTKAGQTDYLDRFDFLVDAQFGKIVYDNYPITDLVAKGHLTPTTMSFEEFSTNVGQSDFKIAGTLENALGYAMKGETLGGKITLYSKLLDTDELMAMAASTDTEATSETTTPTTTTEATPKGNPNEIFGRFDVDADLALDQIKYDIYDIRNVKGQGNIRHDVMDFESLTMNIGESDFAIKGDINDLFAYLYAGGTINGDVQLTSNYINADEFMYTEESTTSETTTTSTETTSETSTSPASKYPLNEVFGKFDFNVDANIKKMKYDIYTMKNMVAKGEIMQDVMRIEDFSMFLGNSDFKASGVIENAIAYLYQGAKLKGTIDFGSKFLDVNQFMVTDEAVVENAQPKQPVATTTEMEPFLVPANMEIALNTKLDKVMYGKMEIKNVAGAMTVRDEKVSMNDVVADVFGGSIDIDGGYDTQDKEKPKFEFAYDMKKFNANEAYKQLDMVKAIAPIMAYVDGEFNSTFSLNGILGDNMMPDYSSLNSTGLLETINAAIKNYEPFNEVAQKLNLKEFSNLQIQNSKNYFEIKDGKVEVKPFDFSFKDIDVNVQGFHGINQDMDYTMKVQVPRELLDKNAATATVNTGIDLLSQQAQSLGLNIENGDYINLNVLLTGKVAKPNVKIQLLGTQGTRTVKDIVTDEATNKVDEVKDQAQQAADSLKKVAENTVDKTKDEAQKQAEEALRKAEAAAKARADSIQKALEEKIQAEKDKVSAQVKDQVDKATENMSKEAKDELNKLKDSVNNKLKDKVGSEVGDKAKEELDKLKNKFKLPKKKKDGN